jgi:hypothetical protein
LSQPELEKVLINRTYPLGGNTLKQSKGAMYFSAYGTFEIVWEGAKGKGKWKADNNSRFCYTQSLWEGEECITLLRNNEKGGFVHIFEGNKRMLEDGARHLFFFIANKPDFIFIKNFKDSIFLFKH